MSAKIKIILVSSIILCSLPLHTIAIETHSLAEEAIARELGWVNDPNDICGGYYVEPPFTFRTNEEEQELVEIASLSGVLSQRTTSVLEGNVTVNRYGQQMLSNKAFIYRDPKTLKLSRIDLVGNVNLREPNTLIVAKQGRYYFDTKAKSLMDIIYRTVLNTKKEETEPPKISESEMQKPRRVTGLTAWGRAADFSQKEPLIYELTQTSYSTCPPIHPMWQLQASHIVLNKVTGRGYATHARVFIKKVPVFYFPYINFSIDKQRKSGFLWPRVAGSSSWGPYILAPFYWNMAPNYDMTITPGILSKRGIQLTDNFRYLTRTSNGHFNVSALPHDRAFAAFQRSASKNLVYTQPKNMPGQPASMTQSELNRLLSSSTTRKAVSFLDDSRFNENWSSHVDFNYAGDDYYLQDFSRNINDVSQNQLLQQGDLYYKNPHWDFTGRLQAYQTLHPINEAPLQNVYRRFPQLVLNGDYPDQPLGLEYFIQNEATHFEILNTPGIAANLPMGNRLHTQPGISLPLYWPYFYVNPRLQWALTKYELSQTGPTNTPDEIGRGLPIFDVASGLSFVRDTTLFRHQFEQTLEPQAYYVYIPYVKQSRIPVFDTTVNNLTYDQLFNYNRFTGIDRIGDANQLSLGVSSRLIDRQSGWEKAKIGIGEIIYFSERHVTLCNSPLVCSDNPTNPSNTRSVSPLSGMLEYHVNDHWKFNANSLWDPISKQLSNATLLFQYQPDEYRVLNLGYTFARSGDILSGVQTNDARNNLKVTDVSFSWPVIQNISALGRWSQDWTHGHLQNVVYGLQYDSCCWAVQLVGGRTFIGLDANHNYKPQYNTEFTLQVSLKGLGDVGTGNPTALLNTISGYKSHFGQGF